jgi:hypothetical protein
MGRPQKHINHPLYKLRLLLSERGRAITQPELARLIDVPLPTLQSIECGRRGTSSRTGLNKELREKIERALFAVWNDSKRSWMFKFSDPPREFSYQLFEQYRRFIKEHAALPRTDVEILKMVIDALFQNVPKDKWMNLHWRIQECLEDCHQDFKGRRGRATGPEDLFKKKELEDLIKLTRSKIHLSSVRLGLIGGGYNPRRVTLQRTYNFVETDCLRAYYQERAKHYEALSKDPSAQTTWSDPVVVDEEPLEEKMP